MLKTFTAVAFSIGLATAAVAQTSTSPSTSPSTTPGASGTTTGSTAGSSGAAMKSEAECTTNFRSLDKNNDGRLDQAEMDANKALLPSALSTSSTVSQQQFMSSCSGK